MSPEAVKNLIRKGQTQSVLFMECPSASEIIDHVQLISKKQNGYILIGVKKCGTVVGLKRSELQLQQRAQEAIKNTPLTLHLVTLITSINVIVISHKINNN